MRSPIVDVKAPLDRPNLKLSEGSTGGSVIVCSRVGTITKQRNEKQSNKQSNNKTNKPLTKAKSKRKQNKYTYK
jgi:hypothetical protein